MKFTLKENIDRLKFQHVDSFMKMVGALCPHALGVMESGPKENRTKRIGCPICKYVLEDNDPVSIVKASPAELCFTSAKELLR